MSQPSAGVWRSMVALVAVPIAVLPIAVLPMAALPAQAAAGAQDVWVAPAGNDKADGSRQRPVRSLVQARNLVRQRTASMTADIVVHVAPGTYPQSTAVTFTGADSGRNGHRVLWQGEGGEVRVTGGRQITGWRPVGDGVYKAKAGATSFRQLYVNHRPAVSARTPNAGNFHRVASWDQEGKVVNVPSRRVPAKLDGVELVANIHWRQVRLRVAGVRNNGDTSAVIPADPERDRLFLEYPRQAKLRDPGQAFFWQNHRSFLDFPGEWWLDEAADEVYYKPRANENLATALVEAPQSAVQLLSVAGTAAKPVHHVTFTGLTFELATWMRPAREGLVQMQAGAYVDDDNEDDGYGFVPAAVTARHAHHLTFVRNTFRNLGADGLHYVEGVFASAIVGNRFVDIAGGGIAIDSDPAPMENLSTARADAIDAGAVHDIAVHNNVVARVGFDYTASVGIFTGFTRRVSIEHNHVRDLPYTGISVGWGWSVTEIPQLGGNTIARNDVAGVVLLHDDGGGIYTLSAQRGTTIAHNRVRDITRSTWADIYPIAGIYLDGGSRYMTVTDNVVTDVEERLFQQINVPACCNTIARNAGTSPDTINRAGLEPAYRDLPRPR